MVLCLYASLILSKDENEGTMTNLAIIGCGERGMAYARAALSLGLQVVVCADVVESRAKKLARMCSATSSTRPLSAVRGKRVDAVVITTPTPMHGNLVDAAAKAGKHILCEGPLARTGGDAMKITKAVQGSGVRLAIGHGPFVQPEYRGIDAQLSEGKIGDAGFIHIHRSAPLPLGAGRWYRDYEQSGGAAFDLLSGDYTWVAHRFGPVAKVFCQSLEKKKLNLAMVTLTLRSGVIAQLVGSWSALDYVQSRLKIEVCGESGMIQFDSTERSFVGTSASVDSQAAIMEGHLRALVEGGNSKEMIEAAVESVRVGEVALESARTGKAVRL